MMYRRGLSLVAVGTIMLAVFIVPHTAAMAAFPPPKGKTTSLLIENFSRNSAKGIVLKDGDVFRKWRVIYSGSLSGISSPYIRNGFFILNPEPVADPLSTNAALIVSQASFSGTNLKVESSWTTTAQTRVNSPPNPWEVGWLVWDYLDPEHFTYLVLKPNGWEIGRRDPAYPGGQRFIATGETLLTPVGQARTAVVKRTGTNSHIIVDGVPLATFQVQEGETSGAVGMYVEDGTVQFDWIRVNSN